MELQAVSRAEGTSAFGCADARRARTFSYLDEYLTTGRTPMPCHALRASCFIDPWGVVYPCISYSRPIGRLRETGMRLDPIWNALETKQLQREIWKGTARSAGRRARRIRASWATPSPAAGAVAARDRGCRIRRRRRPSSRHERIVLHRRRDQARLEQGGHAARGDRRVGGHCREAGSSQHRRSRRSHMPVCAVR